MEFWRERKRGGTGEKGVVVIRRGKGGGRSSDMYSKASFHFEVHKATLVGSNLPQCACDVCLASKKRKTNKYKTIKFEGNSKIMNKSKILVMLSRERDFLRRLPYCWVPPY